MSRIIIDKSKRDVVKLTAKSRFLFAVFMILLPSDHREWKHQHQNVCKGNQMEENLNPPSPQERKRDKVELSATRS